MKNLLFVLLALMPILSFGQERENIVLPKISLPLSIFENSIGWYYDNDGQWISNRNNIANRDDFSKLEFRNVVYKDKKFILFIKYYITGYYKYPNLEIGYTSYTASICYLLNEKDYLEKINSDSIDNLISFPILKKMRESAEDKEYFIKNLQKKIYRYCENKTNILDVYDSPSGLSKSTPFYLYLQYRRYDAKNIIRFFIFDGYNNSHENLVTGGLSSNYATSDVFTKLGTNDIYNLYYYEANKFLFLNFLKLKR